MDTIHKISNITSDEVILNTTCKIHKLIADREYEDGTIDKQTTCIVNQAEYEEIKEHGYYHVYDDDNLMQYEVPTNNN